MSVKKLSTNVKILLASMAGCFAVTQYAFSQETFKCGPYSLAPVMNYYVIVEKVPCKVTITVNIKDQNKGERLLMRVFDPDEKILSWIYKDDFNVPLTTFARFFNYITGKKSLISGSKITKEIILKDKPGIYEFRFQGGLCNSTVTLESDQKLEYGIAWQEGVLRPFSEKPVTMYVYIPKGLDFLKITGGGTVATNKGGILLKDNKIDVLETDTVWEVTFNNTVGQEVRVDMPMVFCTSEAAARKIKNSVEVAEDGSWLCFKAQQKIPPIINRLWDKKYVGEMDKIIVPLSGIRDQALADPVRCYEMVNFIALVPALLREQDRQNGRLKLEEFEALALIAGTGAEINPYCHKKELVYRTAIALLNYLYHKLCEDELVSIKPGTDKNLGGIAFARYDRNVHAGWCQVDYDILMVANSFGPIGRALAQLDPEAYNVIRALMRRMTDHTLTFNTTGVQSKVMNVALAIWQFYEATGDKRYKEQALIYLDKIIQDSGKAGYHVMYGGPDGAYEGQILGQLAQFYCWSKNEKKVADHIKKVFTLYNHTVAPEPNSKIIGASSFYNACIGGIEHSILGSSLLFGGSLPEAAIWAVYYYDTRYQTNTVDLYKTKVSQAIDNPPGSDVKPALSWGRSIAACTSYEFYTDPEKVRKLLNDSGYTWPALETDDFIRNFGDEFIFVKRRGYYTCVYVGKPVPAWPNGNGDPKNLRKIQDSVKSDGAYVSAGDKSKLVGKQPVEGNASADFAEFTRIRAIGNVIGYSGGTIALLWSKEYGASILGYNVAPTTRHGLIFTDPSGDRWWDDYYKTEFTLDEQKGILHVKGRIENQPVRYERIYDFKDDHLEYTLKLFAESATNAVSLVENFPVAMKYKAMKGREKEESVEIAKADFNGQSAVRMTSKSTGKSVIIANNKNLEVEILPDYVGGQGSIQFHLPATWEAGKEWSVVFSVVPEGLETVKNQ